MIHPRMNRRALLALAAAPWLRAARSSRYEVARIEGASSAPVPSGRRAPFGWGAIRAADSVRLRFPSPGDRFRVSIAIDSREPKIVEVRTAETGARVGEFDMRFAYALQMFEAPLDNAAARAARREGLVLRTIRGSEPPWIFSTGAPPPLLPHLLRSGAARPLDEFHRRMQGPEVLQPFGWMDGCVLDGLAQAGYRQALDRHLARFVPDGVSLVYEDARSAPADGRIASIEESLPVAHIVLRNPGHPAIAAAIDYWNSHRDAEHCIVDGAMTSAEGCYTVAYPLARVARARRDRDLEDLAVLQLRLRARRLVAGDDFFLRNTAGGSRTFRNWSRGVAWYMLGLVRTLDVLKDREDLQDLRRELQRMTEWALRRQSEGGLWSCFLDDPATGPETSGSAGIAAAVVLASAAGLAGAGVLEAAAKTSRALVNYLTPDGFLSGVTQSNRGGEQLQRSGYRVLSQMGMGLMAQLLGACDQARRSS